MNLHRFVRIALLACVVAIVVTGIAAAHGVLGPHSHYRLHDADDWGLWGISQGNTQVWVMLVEANPDIPNDRRMLPGYVINVPEGLIMTEDGHAVPNVQRIPGRSIEELTGQRGTGDSPQPGSDKLPQHVEAGMGISAPWVLLLIALLFLSALVWIATRRTGQVRQLEHQIREADARLVRQREVHSRDMRSAVTSALNAERDNRRMRIRQNAYAGPPVVAGGLPTGNMAANYMVDLYRRRFPAPEGDDRNTQLISVSPIWARGYNMRVGYASDVTRSRDLMTDQPAWRGTFSSGVVLDVLQICANGLFSEVGGQLRDDQVRPREGVPALTGLNRPVYQELAGQPTPAPATAADVPAQAAPEASAPASPEAPALPAPETPVEGLPVYDGINGTGTVTRLRLAGTDSWGEFNLSIFPGAEIVTSDGEVRLRQGEGSLLIGRWQDPPAVPSADSPVPAPATPSGETDAVPASTGSSI